MIRGLYERLQVAVTPLVLAADKGAFNIKPDSSKAPGAGGIQDAINGFAFYALLACGAGFLISAATWSIGGRMNNGMASDAGKLGMWASVGTSFLVGASSAILNFAFDLGKGG
jgi:hypothetical protein